MNYSRKDNLSFGLLFTSLYDQYQNTILRGIQHQASIHDSRTICFIGELIDETDSSPCSHNVLYKLISSETVDAMILLSGCLGKSAGTDGVLQFLEEYPSIPAVCIGTDVPGVPSIVVDNEIGMKECISHMIDVHGCHNIAFIKGPENNDEANARFNAYKQSLAEHNLPLKPELIAPGCFDVNSGPDAVRYLVDEKKVSFDAMVGADDITILLAIELLKQRGFRIPQDVKIAGFDDVEHSRLCSPPLTTVRQPLFDLGRTGVTFAVDLIAGKEVPQKLLMPTELVVRKSCGCAPKYTVVSTDTSGSERAVSFENLFKSDWQPQEKITSDLEHEMVRWLGNRLNVTYDIEEIKRLLTQYLPTINIQECYLSLYDEDRSKARLLFALSGEYAQTNQKVVYPAKEIIPGGLSLEHYKSIFIMPLMSELDQIGFEVFIQVGTEVKKYQTLSEEIAGAINGAMLVEKTRQQNVALRKSEEDLQITLNSIGEAVIATDAFGIVTRMNPMAEKITGWKAEEVLQRSLMDFISLVDADSGETIVNPIDRVIHEGNVIDISSRTILITKENDQRRIVTSGAPIRNQKGVIVGVVLVFRDVTEQYRMEEQLRQVQKMDSIGQLAGGIAHDFNNMLAGISGAAELIAFRANKDERIARFVDLILDTTVKAADLNKKLLAFSRKAKVQNVPLDTHACIVQAVQILKHTIDRRVAITMELNAGVSTIIGDASQIQNIILNLGLNARDAMPDGGELTLATANIELLEDSCRKSPFTIEPGSFIEIIVRDTGIGMPHEVLEHIFDPFYTTKEVGKGTGLGLAAAYGIVGDHHGAIHAFSEVDKGSVFKVYLPVDETAVVSKKEDKEEALTGTGRILVVDDEFIIRETLEALLVDLGYEVLLAKDGDEAAEMYRDAYTGIDLVILDMVMPKMGGYDTFKVMKEINPAVKILLSSGFSRGADMDELQQEGASGFIQKPFQYVELSKIVSSALNSTGHTR